MKIMKLPTSYYILAPPIIHWMSLAQYQLTSSLVSKK